MNPVPTDAQWLILHQVDDDEVNYVGGGSWYAKAPIGTFKVTSAIERLLEQGLVVVTVRPTDKGQEVLKRRSVYDVLERLNRRKAS